MNITYIIVFLITNICLYFGGITNNIFFTDEKTSMDKNTTIVENAEDSENTFKYTVDNIIYELNKNTKTASVVKVKNYNAKKIIIPEKINGYTVTKIEKQAFGEAKYKKWKVIILPDTIIELKEKAFSMCQNLIYIKLPKNLKKIDNSCFQYCYKLTSIKLPDSVNYIGEGAFYNCILLKNVNIPKSLTTLNSELFYHCISLKDLNVHKKITVIEPKVFERCSANLFLQHTIVDKDNPIYKKQGNCIVNKKDGLKVVEFAIKNDSYDQKVAFAKKLYKTMQKFLKENKKSDVDGFDDVCIEYLKQYCKPQKLLTKDEFEKKSKDRLILYRGVTKKEYLDDFKEEKIFFAPNINNEKGNGIYVTSEYDQAKYFMFDQNPKYTDKLLQYFKEHPELEEMEKSLDTIEVQKIIEEIMKKMLPYGGIITMFMDNETKILDSDYLDECKDLIFLSQPKKFKEAIPFNGEHMPMEVIKELKLYQTKEEKLMHNSGLLARLLGYDAVYSKENQLDLDDSGYGCNEYLIVNPEVLNVLVD